MSENSKIELLAVAVQFLNLRASAVQCFFGLVLASSRVLRCATLCQFLTERRAGTDAFSRVRWIHRLKLQEYGSHCCNSVMPTITDIARFKGRNPVPELLMDRRIIRANPGRPLRRHRFFDQTLNKLSHFVGNEQNSALDVCPFGPIVEFTQSQFASPLLKRNIDRDRNGDYRTYGLHPSCVSLLNRCCGGIHA